MCVCVCVCVCVHVHVCVCVCVTVSIVYKELDEAVKKHQDATVMINFASLRSAYDATMATLEYPQVSWRWRREDSEMGFLF